MAGIGFIDDVVLFSTNMSEEVNRLLQAAVVSCRADKLQAEALFLQALSHDKHCLQVYFALYKFYFYQARLNEAEMYVLLGLEEAASQAGFPGDYRLLYRDKSKWDLYANETSLFYLYSLKALAFIKLRKSESVHARTILNIIKALDPEDRSGASVIMDLSAAVDEVN